MLPPPAGRTAMAPGARGTIFPLAGRRAVSPAQGVEGAEAVPGGHFEETAAGTRTQTLLLEQSFLLGLGEGAPFPRVLHHHDPFGERGPFQPLGGRGTDPTLLHQFLQPRLGLLAAVFLQEALRILETFRKGTIAEIRRSAGEASFQAVTVFLETPTDHPVQDRPPFLGRKGLQAGPLLLGKAIPHPAAFLLQEAKTPRHFLAVAGRKLAEGAHPLPHPLSPFRRKPRISVVEGCMVPHCDH